jgi:murein L,D-transpeptidase YafK
VRRTRRILVAVAAAGFAVVAVMLAPFWLPVITQDPNAALDMERSKRRALATVGMAMPGQPDLARFDQRLAEHGLLLGAPVFIRIFKREFELEMWMQRDGVFHRFATYAICRWSGGLGPKLKEGDRQAPEGFYTVDKGALNPNSQWYRSFNLGYPNVLERSFNRTGSLIMVHGGCASIGCFAMTNGQMDEIWRLVTAALEKGQKRFQVQVFPFRMSEQNLAAMKGHADLPLWKNLRTGHDLFEATLLPPRVSVCKQKYVFAAGAEKSTGEALVEAGCQGQQATR